MSHGSLHTNILFIRSMANFSMEYPSFLSIKLLNHIWLLNVFNINSLNCKNILKLYLQKEKLFKFLRA